MEKKYLDYRTRCEARLAVLERRFHTIGLVKLVHLAVLITCLWQTYRSGLQVPLVFLAILLLAVGVVLWIYHVKLGDRLGREKELLAVLECHLQRLNGGWTEFVDDGREFVSYHHPYTYDLDVFGPRSVFQLLNVARTSHGRSRFASDLCGFVYAPDEIVHRQRAVAELAVMDELSLAFQVRSNGIRENESVPRLLEALCGDNAFVGNEWMRLLLRYAPGLFGPAIVLILLFFPQLYLTAGVLLILQMMTWAVLAAKTLRYLSPVGKMKYGLGRYATLFELLDEQDFQCEKLLAIQGALVSDDTSAAKAFRELDRIVQRVELRRNAILYFLFNALFLWDIGCALSLERWRKRYTLYFEEWFERLGEFESILSFSMLERCTPHLVYPECVESEIALEAGRIGHPLIPNDRRVYNDLQMHGGITIVSGSNMSGKTTFLRTVGINLVLAQAGAPVCAGYMRFSVMRVVTSMRISDDLSEGVSTFYAELKKIKAIIDSATRHRNTIFLIDEIFKGTNSADRIAGARQVIRRLSSLHTPGFLTTHDLALCDWSAGENIQNCHFSEQYEGDTIVFDYTMRPGIAQSTNAEFLMRMVGILD